MQSNDIETGKPERDAVSRLASFVARANGALCEAILVGLVVVVALEVVLRNTVGVSLQFMEEVSSYFLVLITFLAFSVSLRDGALFRVDVLWERLPVFTRNILQVVLDLVSIGIVVILLRATSLHVWSSFSRGTISPTELSLPLWIPQLAMPAGLIFVLLVLVAGIKEIGRKLKRGQNVKNASNGMMGEP
jgi:TRAP-type C4-dicarboxylate transport system permease small subunit